MNVYNILAVSLVVIIYVYLVQQIRTGTARQNLATWTSWVLLDIVAGTSLYVQGGNWYLIAIYVVGGSIIVATIIQSSLFELGWVEIVCFILVVVCIVMWKLSGPQYATVISTIGVAIATYPQIKDAYYNPTEVPLAVYVGFTLANILATIAGKGWTIDERFYPATCSMLCVVIVILTMRRYQKPRGV